MPLANKPIIWTVAGSDSGAGAGIQADLHTFKALDCHGCSIISCITAQNSVGIAAYENVSPMLLIAQLNCLLEDMPPRVIKIGLVPDADLLHELVIWLKQHKLHNNFTVVADPVLSCSTGFSFTKQSLLSVWRYQLLPLVDVVTPNLPELALLSDLAQHNIEQQATQLLSFGAAAVIVSGGHGASNSNVTDTLYTASHPAFAINNRRLNTPHTHGTGCVFSSSVAAALAQDYPLTDAIIIANACVQQALTQAYATGSGAGSLYLAGWPEQAAYFPELPPTKPSLPVRAFASMPIPIGLYPVVDNVEWLRRLIPLAVDTIQLRIKHGSENEIEQQIANAVALAHKHNLRLFINDHWRLAIKYGAYGVHLGQDDLRTADLAALNKAGLRLGISTHSYVELLSAMRLKPSYIALGHVFATNTKKMPSKPQGLLKLARYVRLCNGIPTVAIGGITAELIPAVCERGVDGIAVVSAITAQSHPEQAFTQLKQLVGQHYAYHR